MVYANDEWVQMPVMQLYDTGLMQQAINNARYMYEKAEKRMDDFYEKYGEFMSPFQKDMDRYQQIVGGIRRGIDALYASGEDPLRTASGRAKMAQLIRSVDPAEMSRMKANAKMGYAYLDDIEKARARNEFNADYENFLLNQPGGPGAFNDFSSANGAMWTRSAAGRYQDLNQYTGHIFDALKDSFIRTDGPYDYYGVTEGDLAKSLTPDTLGGLLNTDLGKFHYQNAIRDLAAQGNFNPTKADMMEQFRKNVIAANHEKVHENRSINELWKMRQEHNSRMAAARASRASQDGEERGPQGPTPLHQQIMNSVNRNIAKKMGVSMEDSTSFDRSYALNQIIDYYTKKLDERKQALGKKVQEGETSQKVFAINGPGMLSAGNLSYDKKSPKYKYEYDAKNDSYYKKLEGRLGMYKALQNGTYEPLSKVERDRYNQLANKMRQNKPLTDHEQKVFKVLYDKEQRIISWVSDRWKEDFYKAVGNERKGGDQFAKANDEYYSMFRFTPRDRAAHQTALGELTNFSEKREYKSLPGKYHVVEFKSDGLQYTPIRQASVAGPRKYKYNSLQNRFSRWLTQGGMEGVLFDEHVDYATIPEVGSPTGNIQLDVNARPSISHSDFQKFMSKLPKEMRDLGTGEIARRLGLQPRGAEGTILNSDKDGYNSASFFDVPVTKTMSNNSGFSFSQMDNDYNKLLFGESNAYNNAINNEASSLTPIINIP